MFFHFLFVLTRKRLEHQESVVTNLEVKMKQKKIQLQAVELRHRKLQEQLAAVEKIRTSSIKYISALSTKVIQLNKDSIIYQWHLATACMQCTDLLMLNSPLPSGCKLSIWLTVQGSRKGLHLISAREFILSAERPNKIYQSIIWPCHPNSSVFSIFLTVHRTNPNSSRYGNRPVSSSFNGAIHCRRQY